MNRFIKNTKAIINILQLTTRDLETTQKNITQKTKRNAIPKYKVKISDIITVIKCKKQYSQRLEKKTTKTKNQIKKETAKVEKKKTKTTKQTAKIVKKTSKVDAKTRNKTLTKKIQTNKKIDNENTKIKKKNEATNHTFDFFTSSRPFTSLFYDIISNVTVLKKKRVRKPSKKTLKKNSVSTSTLSSSFSQKQQQ